MSPLTLTLPLRYPDAWLAPANPHGRAAGARATATLQRWGLLGPRSAPEVAAMAPHALGALPFPAASAEALAVITEVLALWALYDDAIEWTGERDIPCLIAALRGDLADSAAPSPWMRAWAAIGRSCRGRMSPAWRERFAANLAAAVASVEEEAGMRRRAAGGGAPPEQAEYLPWRRANVGLLAVADLIELDLGEELPADLRDDPDLRGAARQAGDMLIALNDLSGVPRDNYGLNLVACHAADAGIPLAAACRRVLAWHDAALERFLRHDAALRARRADEPLVSAWLDRLGWIVAGFARWHAAAPRYHAAHAASGVEIRLAVPEPAEAAAA